MAIQLIPLSISHIMKWKGTKVETKPKAKAVSTPLTELEFEHFLGLCDASNHDCTFLTFVQFAELHENSESYAALTDLCTVIAVAKACSKQLAWAVMLSAFSQPVQHSCRRSRQSSFPLHPGIPRPFACRMPCSNRSNRAPPYRVSETKK